MLEEIYLLGLPGFKENVDIYHRDNNDMTAFKIAFNKQNTEIIEYLILERELIIDNEIWKLLHNNQNSYSKKILEIIEKRDFVNKLSKDLSPNEISKKKIKYKENMK